MAHDPLGSHAFINCDLAECRYEADDSSPARITPPYGTKIAVIRDEGDWVLIAYAGKEAWSPRDQLSIIKPKDRFDISPYIFSGRLSHTPVKGAPEIDIEYGPRGGRFTRTRTGSRRYF